MAELLNKLLICNATIVDGTGRPGFPGDIAVDGDTITGVGAKLDAVGRTVLDAAGLVASPGFIDIHTHTDRKIFDNPRGESKIMQGVTTEVTGNCGVGPFPAQPGRLTELETYLNTLSGSLPEGGITWTDFASFAATVEKLNPGINLAMLVAHGTLRIAAVGLADRPPTAEELALMEQILAASLEQGAWGMSSGLVYPPGSFAKTDELIALGKVLANHQALYTSHIRGESATLRDALEEAITIGRESGVRVEVSHLKAIGKPFWGQGLAALRRIEEARRQGVDIWADQYPYEATATALTRLVPDWAHDGGTTEMLKRLRDGALAQRLDAGIGDEMNVRGGPERVKISYLTTKGNERWIGKTIADVAADRGIPAVEAVRQLLLEENGRVNAVYFSLGVSDLEGIISSPDVAVGSDGQVMSPDRDGLENVHPRSYGTFPRVLGLYAREKGLLPLETAVRKMTALPASILRLPDRGTIKPGFKADITLFDPATVIDTAGFDQPHRYPVGIPHVIVNGTFAVRDARLTGNGRGYVLRKPR